MMKPGEMGMSAPAKTSYVDFTPPEGTVPPDATEGEASVKWTKKADGGYCITEFEGEPVGEPDESSEEEGPSVEDTMDEAMGEEMT